MAKIATPKAGTKSAAPARKRASRQPNNGKAATTASTRPTQTQASPKSAPRTKVTAAELLKRERKFQQQEQIAEATTTAEELAELQAQLAEFEHARAALQRKGEKPSDQFVAQEREFQAEAERLERELVAKGEDVGRIAQFGLASRRIRDMAPPREGDYTPPPASEYFEAVHQLLAVTDHTVVSQKELDERRQNQKMGELVFCACREHNQNSYQIRPREGKPFKIFGSYFSFDHYSQWQKGSRTTIWLASRTWFAIRDAEKAVRSEIRELEEKAIPTTAADVLELTCAPDIVAVPVVFRDGSDGGKLLLECSGNEVTLRAATHRGMQKILADAFGQSLTGEPRRDGKGVWFEGPKLLISILQSSRAAAEEREQSTLTAQKEDPSRAPSIQRLEELGEELKRSRRTSRGSKSSGKAETDGKAKARKPKVAPKIEEEEIAAVSDEPTAEEPPDEPDTASPTRSYGPDDNPESPFAALKDVVAEDSQESEAEATK